MIKFTCILLIVATFGVEEILASNNLRSQVQQSGTNSPGATFGMNVLSTKDQASIPVAIDDEVKRGVRNFRVVNIGGWNDAAYTAINNAAGQHPTESFSIQIPSNHFDSPSDCSSFPPWMDFSMQKLNDKFKSLTNIKRKLIQMDFGSICQTDPGYNNNPTELGLGQDVGSTTQRTYYQNYLKTGYTTMLQNAHKTFPIDVEFIIPYMNARASPDNMIQYVSGIVAPMRAAGRKVYLQGTHYTFWNPVTTYVPFPVSQVNSVVDIARGFKFDGYVVVETGWAHNCPTTQVSHGPASVQNMCAYLDSTVKAGSRAELVYLFKTFHDSFDICGDNAWNIYDSTGKSLCNYKVPP